MIDRIVADGADQSDGRQRVVDSTTQQPIGSVNIVVEGTQRGALSRDDGSFIIEQALILSFGP